MSTDGNQRVADDAIHTLTGDDLLQHLRQGWKPLPTNTLFALVIGGLKVRLARSTVTMVSIILAIAFLAYMGLAGKLNYSIAFTASTLETADAPPLQDVRRAARSLSDPSTLDGLAVSELSRAAVSWGMSDLRAAERQLEVIQNDLEALREEEASLTTTLEGLRERGATAQQINRTRSLLALTGDRIRELELRERDWARVRELAGLVRTRNLDAGQEAALRRGVGSVWEEALGDVARTGRVDATRASGLEQLVEALAISRPEDTSVQKLRDFLRVEEGRRLANQLALSLRRAGVNMQATLEGSQLNTWLIVMALLLCTVGIANAMLMSVTERFREIGTMKCLGATDSLVVKIFLMESGMLGVVGAILGLVLGLLIALLFGLIQYGLNGIVYFPFLGAWTTLLLSLLAGIALAVVGTIYPALLASRMKPVDALRVDE